MSERFTPSEYFEAQDKKEQHQKGRDEAKFYRNFLDTFYNRVVSQLLRKDINKKLGAVDINKTTLKLREFEFCNPSSLNGYVQEAMGEASKLVDKPVKGVAVDMEQIADMTPVEFVQYINSLKKSFIKD